jgi:hypothetical protein
MVKQYETTNIRHIYNMIKKQWGLNSNNYSICSQGLKWLLNGCYLNTKKTYGIGPMLCCPVLQLRGCQKSFSFNVFRRWLFGQGWLSSWFVAWNKQKYHIWWGFLRVTPQWWPLVIMCVILLWYITVLYFLKFILWKFIQVLHVKC